MKIVRILLTIIVSLCVVSTNAQNLDYDFEVDGICYKVTSVSEFTVGVSYKGSSNNGYVGDIIIPEHIIHDGQNYSVTSIRDEAFDFSTKMTSITIPSSVTNIGTCAFEYCSGLTSITIPNSVTSIGDKVFKDCSGLTLASIGDAVTYIGEDTFYGCSKLTSVTIGASVTSIGKRAFCGCKSLSSVIIPNLLKEIGERTFSGCSALQVVSLGNSVTDIGKYAFYGCKELTSITFPKSTKRIASNAFDSCTGLTTVVIGNPAPVIDHVVFNKCTGLTNVYCFSKTVPTIGVGSFPATTAKNATLYVPTSSIESYKKATTWKEFGTITSLPIFTLIYIVDGIEYKKVDIAYGDSIVLETEPTKEGHTFSGWSEVPETMPAQDVTVTGSFTVNGIDSVVSDKFVDVYTLQGVMLKHQISIEDLEKELPAGIYIVNGKKMIVR